jgi:plastocyanin
MRRQIARAIATAAVIGFVLVPAPAGAGGGHFCPDPLPATEAGQVIILDNCFTPSNLEVKTGETVRWDLEGGGTHTVTFPNLNSGDVAGSFSARFNSPGTYAYSCLYHPGMLGAITVVGNELAGEPVEPVSDINPMAGEISYPVSAPVEALAGETIQDIQNVNLQIGVAGALIIAAGLVLVAVVSAAGTTIAVRLARR